MVIPGHDLDLMRILCHLFLSCHVISGRVITKPESRMIAIQKTEVILNCATNLTGITVYWLHLPVNETIPRRITTGSSTLSTPGYSVTGSQDEGAWNLRMESVDFDQAGRYIFQDSEDVVRAELVVLSDNSTCTSVPEMESGTVEVKANESVTLECTVRYSGAFEPSFYWIDATGDNSTFLPGKRIMGNSRNSIIQEFTTTVEITVDENTSTRYLAITCPFNLFEVNCQEFWRTPRIRMSPPGDTPRRNVAKEKNTTFSDAEYYHRTNFLLASFVSDAVTKETSSPLSSSQVFVTNSFLFQLLAVSFVVLIFIGIVVCLVWGFTLLQRHRRNGSSQQQQHQQRRQQHQQQQHQQQQQQNTFQGKRFWIDESSRSISSERRRDEEVQRENETYEEISLDVEKEYERTQRKIGDFFTADENVEYCPLRTRFSDSSEASPSKTSKWKCREESLKRIEYLNDENTVMDSEYLNTTLSSSVNDWNSERKISKCPSNHDYLVLLP